VSLLFSLVFIARTAFIVNGRYYFTLFDDAMISMRYARNLAEGHGLVWNAGQAPVEGYTNFLWTLWMALVHLAGAPESTISLLVMVSGALILAANLAVVRSIAERVAPDAPRAVLLAVWLTALYYPLVFWTLRGMEVGLVTLLVSASVLLAARLHDRFRDADLFMLAAVMAVGIVTRPDVVVPCAAVAAFVVVTSRADRRVRVLLVLGAAIGGTFAVHTAFRVVYYGDWLPNTYYLKVSGAALDARLARGLRGLAGFTLLHLLVPLALSAAYVISGRTRLHGGVWLLAAIFLALCGYSAYVGGDAWDAMFIANRYITPGVPGLLIVTALAIDRVFRRDRHLLGGVSIALVVLFVVVAAVNAIGPAATLGVAATANDERLRIVRAALVLAPVVVLPFVARARGTAAVVLAAGTLVAMNGLAVAEWIDRNAAHADYEASATRYALALRRAVPEDASIAVTWAGVIPYFSGRASVDLLGKSDRFVARRWRQPAAGFEPGHDKWDYAYSIGELRPDLVAQLWHASDDDVRRIEGWGYVRLAPWVFVRADSARVDKAAVRLAACSLLRDDPFVLGSPTKSVAGLDDLLVRYCPR